MHRTTVFSVLILFLLFVPGNVLAFLPDCQNTDASCEIGLKDLSQNPSFKKIYRITEVINTDSDRNEKDRKLTRTLICIEEGYILKSRGDDGEKIITYKEQKTLESVIQDFTEGLRKIPNVDEKHYTINFITVGDRVVGWVIRHVDGVDRVDFWILQKKIIFAITFKPVDPGGEGSG